MADETGKTDYVPVLYGHLVWEGRHSRAGAWALVIEHDLIVTTSSEETQGYLLPRGSTVYLVPGSFQTLIDVGSTATCYPRDYERDGHPVMDLINRRLDDAAAVLEFPATLPELPF